MSLDKQACVIDTSAIVAIHFREPDGEALAIRMGAYAYRVLPPSCIVEFCMLKRLGGDMNRWVANFIDEYEVSILSMTSEIVWVAADAATRYGRGSTHPATLNFGDCISYAYAKHLDVPLLYKGDDFFHTDIASAMHQEV